MKTRSWIATAPILLATLQATANDQPLDSTRRELSFAQTMPGQTVTIQKVLTPDGRIKLLSSSNMIATWEELEARRLLEKEALRLRYGNLQPELYEVLDGKTSASAIPVVIALALPAVKHPDKYESASGLLERHSQSLINMSPGVRREEIILRYGLLDSRRGDEPNLATIETVVDAGTLAKLAFDPNIASIERPIPQIPTSYPYLTFTHSAYNTKPMPYGALGSGINAATFESGLHPSNISCMGLNTANVDSHSDSSRTTHSDYTFKAFYNTAPEANHFHRASWSYSHSTSQAWIVNNSIRSMSQSTTGGGGPTTSKSRVMDDFAYRHPFPMFSNPTGNTGNHTAVPNWRHFNGINVGNVRHSLESFYLIDGTTQTANPAPVYGGPILGNRGDRELPNVVAPGLAPDPNNQPATDSCLPNFNFWGGTSVSAPIVNGVVTTVLSADSRMIDHPERVKAAILLTARNVEAGGWDSTVDQQDGAGAISGSDAAWFARNHITVGTNGEAKHGLASGSLSAGNQSQILRYYLRTPRVKPLDRHLRVALVWTSNPSLTAAVNEISDLDLVVRNTATGTVVATAGSLDDNVEIVDIPADAVSVDTRYTVEVHILTTRIPSNATTNFFYYAVGWTWPKDISHEDPKENGYSLGVATATTCGAVASTLDASAQEYCRQRGNATFGTYAVSTPTSGVHSWWNGSSWSTSGNSSVCYLSDIACELHKNPHFENPVPVFQIGVYMPSSCTTSTTLGNSAARFCQDRGYDYGLYYVPSGPSSGVYSWWNGSAWSTSGSSTVCYMMDLGCWNY